MGYNTKEKVRNKIIGRVNKRREAARRWKWRRAAKVKATRDNRVNMHQEQPVQQTQIPFLHINDQLATSFMSFRSRESSATETAPGSPSGSGGSPAEQTPLLPQSPSIGFTQV